MFIKKVDPKFYNPSDTAQILKTIFTEEQEWIRRFNRRTNREEEHKKNWNYKIEENNIKDINLNLLFNKIIPHPYDDNEQKEQKSKHLEFISSLISRSESIKFLLGEITKRINNLVEKMKENNFKVESFSTSCMIRMIIGLGGVHPEETSMTLHHIYGIPYIPGSAIKGVTKHYAVFKLSQGKEELLDKISKTLDTGNLKVLDDIKDPELKGKVNVNEIDKLIEIFGTQKKEGKVIFMDAYPQDEIKLKIDIMNSHYPDYYSGNQPPADWQNPRPINFLTVERTKFRFYLISKEEALIKKAKTYLEEALKNYGIGAKTSLGYGVFTNLQQ